MNRKNVFARNWEAVWPLIAPQTDWHHPSSVESTIFRKTWGHISLRLEPSDWGENVLADEFLEPEEVMEKLFAD